ncbi:argininosuccinate synthase [Anthonomus grandis grandis]|uniref:argininosuccinate synthase n=1 Tax=Anthonomus grandis grandis TaxID=2921223 RepID=UPI002165BA64|nr:argininosuccinate synthase [Anthonomus grandis grandis]
MAKEKVVLAYSGGLDTSCILKWLINKGYDVICYMANIGQDEDFNMAKEKALKIGASKVVIEDIREDFVKCYVWPAISYGLLYENRYLLGTSLARPCISVGLINCVKENDATYIAHGATGKGNDQVRFELSCYTLLPDIKIIAPWRIPEFINRFEGRQDLLKFAAENGIPVSVTPKAPWSMDANLMHISYESGILEDPNQEAPEDLFLMTTSPKTSVEASTRLEITFEKGVPILLSVIEEGKIYSNPLDIMLALNVLGGKHGIGRIDIVENRFLGLKSRGVYETPGVTILHSAHTDLEVFCMDKEVYRVKQVLRERLSDYVYNGFWFSPEGEYTRKCLDLSSETIEGTVKIELYKGSVTILGRSSKSSLYNADLVSMDKHAGFSPEDATGFINIQAIRLKEYNKFLKY